MGEVIYQKFELHTANSTCYNADRDVQCVRHGKTDHRRTSFFLS